VIILFYISYQAYLVSNIPNSSQLQGKETYNFILILIPFLDLEKLSSELEESIKNLDRLEKQQTEFNKFVDDTQKLLNQLQQSNLIQSPKKELPEENLDSPVIENVDSDIQLQVPVLVIACNRPTVSRALDSILSARSNGEMFPIVVSQDCGHLQTLDVIKKYSNAHDHLQYIEQTDRLGQKYCDLLTNHLLDLSHGKLKRTCLDIINYAVIINSLWILFSSFILTLMVLLL